MASGFDQTPDVEIAEESVLRTDFIEAHVGDEFLEVEGVMRE